MSKPDVKIVVVGVGGAGVNAVTRLMAVAPDGVRFVAADTSCQTLARADGACQVLLSDITRGLGTGGDARLGAAAAAGAERELRSCLGSPDLVFVVAGLSGGTGGGAAPEVARIARAVGATVIGMGIRPFTFEASAHRHAADEAGSALRDACDATVLLDNDKAAQVAGGAVPLDVALRVADDVLRQAVQGLAELVDDSGWINVDLANLRDVVSDSGEACLSLGFGRGDEPACEALMTALANPLADMRALARASGLLVQITGGDDLCVTDVSAAFDTLRERIPADCRLVVGVGNDPLLNGTAQVTLLGTGVREAAATSATRIFESQVNLRRHAHEPYIPVAASSLDASTRRTPATVRDSVPCRAPNGVPNRVPNEAPNGTPDGMPNEAPVPMPIPQAV